MIFPLKVVTINNSPFPVLNKDKTVKAGEMLKYELDYCKYVDLPSDTSKQFVNGLVFSTPQSLIDNPVGCHKLIVNVLVPKELPIGNYYLKIVKTYHLNPIRDFNITTQTEEFTVE